MREYHLFKSLGFDPPFIVYPGHLGGASTLALASVRGRGSFRGVMMKRLFLVGLVLLLACSSDPKRRIEPEPSSGGAGGSSGSAGSGGSSEAGNGGTTSAGSGGSSQAGSAGSTSDGGTSGYTSGSRLRAKYLVGTDGSRSFQVGTTACVKRTASSGTRLPMGRTGVCQWGLSTPAVSATTCARSLYFELL